MGKLIKVVDKGYTLKVSSWENDGDYNRTKTHVVYNIEDAKLMYKLCTELFTSEGVGNSMDNEDDSIINEYIQNNIDLFSNFSPETDLLDLIYELGYELMGGSEYYDFRVCESCIITYSAEDIFSEEITF